MLGGNKEYKWQAGILYWTKLYELRNPCSKTTRISWELQNDEFTTENRVNLMCLNNKVMNYLHIHRLELQSVVITFWMNKPSHAVSIQYPALKVTIHIMRIALHRILTHNFSFTRTYPNQIGIEVHRLAKSH